MASIITMPKLSPTMEEGVLAKWTKKEGDKIAPGDIIAEVETDKANMEFPLEDEGVLLKLLVAEGSTVKLGDPVAVLGEAGEDPAEAIAEAGGGGGGQPDPKAAAKPKAAEAKGGEPARTTKTAPATQAANKTAAAAAKAPAQPTSKAAGKAAEAAPAAGKAKAKGESESDEDEADESAEADESDGGDAAGEDEGPSLASANRAAQKPANRTAQAQPQKQAAQAGTQPANGQAAGRVLASPFARKLALEKGVDLRALTGSGPRGRIVKRDIDEAAAGGGETQPDGDEAQTARGATPQPSAGREDTISAPSQMRKTIARRLVEAKREIPHIYLTAEATVDKLFALREQINEMGDVKVSVNDLVIKALGLALRKVPDANVSWTAEGIVRHGAAHVGMAVSLPDNGLITPMIRDADTKSIGAVARETKQLAERARAKKLQPHEYSGGSATVSNLGMYGVREFVAIINPPESVILAVGTTEKRAIVVEKDGRDEVTIARRMTLTLSCDHRVVDGVLGAQLLGAIIQLLEKPMGMLI